MPRYIYKCDSCNGHFQIWHGIKETQESCQICSVTGSLTRIPQIPLIKKDKTEQKKTGTITKDYIRQNQELLKEMKKEARSQVYDD